MKFILNNSSYHTINQIDNDLINQSDIVINNTILGCLKDYLEDVTDLETQKVITNLKNRRNESKKALKENWIKANQGKSFDDWIFPIFKKIMILNLEYNKQFNVF